MRRRGAGRRRRKVYVAISRARQEARVHDGPGLRQPSLKSARSTRPSILDRSARERQQASRRRFFKSRLDRRASFPAWARS
jgi:hypothetical protein